MAHPSWASSLRTGRWCSARVTVRDLIDLTVAAEGSGVFDTIWVGDSLLAKPRLESVTLLPVAGRDDARAARDRGSSAPPRGRGRRAAPWSP